MTEIIYCGRISPSNRIANKLRCIEPYLTYEVWEELEKWKIHVDINSELGVDQLLATAEKIHGVRFIFK
jgi:hypothetical protein